ncbi:TPA: hypothetical protein ACHLAF_004947 [Escherichia coli]
MNSNENFSMHPQFLVWCLTFGAHFKNDGHYFCGAGGNRPDGLNEPVTKKQPLLWIMMTTALQSGCTGNRDHHPQVTFTVDTVRTDTTASNPVCLPEKYGSLLNERHPDLFAGAQGIITKGVPIMQTAEHLHLHAQ